MPKQIQKAEISSFVKGFISESSPLNFPADASRDEENFTLNKDGSRDRRLGIDFEQDHVLKDSGYSEEAIKDIAITQYRWMNAGNDANNEFIVIQFGSRIDIYDSSKTSISSDGYKGQVTLTGVDDYTLFSFATVDGTLVIAAGTEVIHIVKYVSGNFNYSTDRLLVRDIWGLPGNEDNDLNKRPTTQTDAHIYNLRNQGWGIPRKNSSGSLSDPISVFYGQYTKFPSNVETVYAGLQFQAVVGGTPYERMYPSMYDEILGLDAPAARGYFIIDALKRGASRLSACSSNNSKFPSLGYSVSTLPADTTPGGASHVVEFAGRVFYAGFQGVVTDGDTKSPILSSYVLFSQTVKNQEGITKCYQRGDPTSREDSDLVDTDGGMFRVAGCKEVVGMVNLAQHLIIIGSNGVWTVTGGADYGFSATNYSVNRVSTFGCINSKSIVAVNDQVFFWGEDGIYLVSRNQYGDWTVSNISEQTIQSFYNTISRTNKDKAVGIYDTIGKTVRWLYNQDTDQENYNIVREIVLDMKLQAFSKTKFFNLNTNSPQVVGFVITSSFVTGDGIDNVVVSDIQTVVGGEDVTISSVTRTSGFTTIKYLTLYGNVSGKVGYTFSELRDTNFLDWKTANGIGIDAEGFILTGSITAGDSAIKKQTPYLIVHMRKTEEGVEVIDGDLIPSRQSSCKIRTQWDWSNSIISKKWGTEFEAYRHNKIRLIESESDDFDTGFEVVTTKNKLRGVGRALSLYMHTSPGKDCRILGWNLSITGNSLA